MNNVQDRKLQTAFPGWLFLQRKPSYLQMQTMLFEVRAVLDSVDENILG